MIVGGYSLDLYCDYPDTSYPHTGMNGSGIANFAGHSKTDTFRQARKSGWTLTTDNRAMCPSCKAQKRVLPVLK